MKIPSIFFVASGVLFFLVSPTMAATLQGFQGGTGFGTSTASDDGKCLVQSSSTPFLVWEKLPCGGSPGGSDGDVQFNSSGNFAGDSGLQYDTANTILRLQGSNGANPAILNINQDNNTNYDAVRFTINGFDSGLICSSFYFPADGDFPCGYNSQTGDFLIEAPNSGGFTGQRLVLNAGGDVSSTAVIIINPTTISLLNTPVLVGGSLNASNTITQSGVPVVTGSGTSAFAFWNSLGQLTMTSTPSGGGGGGGSGNGNVTVNPSSTVLSGFVPFWTTNGSTTLSPTSSLSFSALTALFANAVNASGTITSNGTPVVLNTRAVNTTSPWLTGGGALSSDLTLNFVNNGFVTAASSVSWTALQNFGAGIRVSGTVVFASTTNSLALLSATGTLLSFTGSACTSGSLVTSISATGTTICITTSTILSGYSTSTSRGTVTTSSALTANSIPIATADGVLSNSSLSQSAGTTFINGVTPLIDGGGNWLSNVIQTASSSVGIFSSLVWGGNSANVGTFTTSTTISSSSFCGVNYGVARDTSQNATITFPGLFGVLQAPCAGSFPAQSFTMFQNISTNTVSFVAGASETILFSPGTPTLMPPGSTYTQNGGYATSTSGSKVFQFYFTIYSTSTLSNQLVYASSTGGYVGLGLGSGLSISGGNLSATGGTGTVTTSSAGTPNSFPLWTSASALGNSSLSQSAGTTFINGATAIIDGGGDWLNNVLQSNVANVVQAVSLVWGGTPSNVGTYNANTVISSSSFCGVNYGVARNTTSNITLTFPGLAGILQAPCAGTFPQQSFTLFSNISTNTVAFIAGASETILFAPGTPPIMQPGTTYTQNGGYATSTTGQTLFQFQFGLFQTSTPFQISGNTISFTSSSIINASSGITQTGGFNILASTTLFGYLNVGTTTNTGIVNIVNTSGTQNLGISGITNSTSSGVTLNVRGNASTSPGASPISVFQILMDGHINATGTTPTVSSCGTNPSVSGSDAMGEITVGSVAATACTLTFQVPYETTPHCLISNQSMSVVNAMTYAITSSTLVISQTGLTNDKVDYSCWINL